MGTIRVTRVLALVVAVVSLTGCASQIDKVDDQRCKSMGALRGTNAYGGCRLLLDGSRVSEQLEKPSRQGVCGAAVNGANCK